MWYIMGVITCGFLAGYSSGALSRWRHRPIAYTFIMLMTIGCAVGTGMFGYSVGAKYGLVAGIIVFLVAILVIGRIGRFLSDCMTLRDNINATLTLRQLQQLKAGESDVVPTIKDVARAVKMWRTKFDSDQREAIEYARQLGLIGSESSKKEQEDAD